MGTNTTRDGKGAVEVEFCVPDRRLFFVEASAVTGGSISLAELFPRADGRLLEYFTVDGVQPERIVEVAGDAPGIDEARLVRAVDDSSLIEFVVSGPCIGGTLANLGAVIREVEAENGTGRVVADVPSHVDVRAVVESVRERHEAEFVACRVRDHSAPEFSREGFRDALLDRLTERQLETLREALASGYYRWPREATAEECAERLGISQPTFAQHIRAGERKVLEALLKDVHHRDAPAAMQ